ncbi:MAG: patatin-like phospholipase family protein [Rhizomicrobium sp.]
MCARGNTADIARLARFISGRAVGLVLAGGGARGFAHIGIMKALQEAGVPLLIIWAAPAWARSSPRALPQSGTMQELSDRVRAAFVDANPLSDYTFPLIALVRGKRVSTLLQENFGDVRDRGTGEAVLLRLVDLTTGRIHEHRSGALWRALRASVALPGILPPVTHHGHLLVDGGVMNNLPVDVMRQRESGPIIASDVTGEIDLQVKDDEYGERPLWWLIAQRMRGTPSIVSILMRSGTCGLGSTAPRCARAGRLSVRAGAPRYRPARLEKVRPCRRRRLCARPGDDRKERHPAHQRVDRRPRRRARASHCGGELISQTVDLLLQLASAPAVENSDA